METKQWDCKCTGWHLSQGIKCGGCQKNDAAQSNRCPLRPLAGRCVVRKLSPPSVSPGGVLLLPEWKGKRGKKVEQKVQVGVVCAVGPGRKLESGELTPSTIRVNDKVIFSTLAGSQEYERDGQVWTLLNQHDVLGRVEKV